MARTASWRGAAPAGAPAAAAARPQAIRALPLLFKALGAWLAALLRRLFGGGK